MHAVVLLSLISPCGGGPQSAGAAVQSGTNATATRSEGQTRMEHVTGDFEVKLSPQATEGSDAWKLGRMLLSKQYRGALEATATGEMLTAMTATKGSAGYVAIEWVTGTLGGRPASFVLQHSSTMDRGTPVQSIMVVPDSGTGELAALRGRMAILVETDGKHRYSFGYTLAPVGP